MSLKSILAIALAVSAAGTVTVNALAATGSSSHEAGAIKSAWSEKRHNPCDKLLEDGIVSQATYDKIKAYFENNAPQKAERTERKNILDTLLGAEIITQAEHDAMKSALPSFEKPALERPRLGEKPSFPDKPQFNNPFDKFVEDGVISESTAAAINEYIKSNVPEKIKIKERVDIFAKMLEEGVITQEEYDAVKAAMPERLVRGKRGGDRPQPSAN